MNRHARLGFALVLLPLAACVPARQGPQTAAPTTLGGADKAFVDQAAMLGVDEIQDGQLAAERTTQPIVRQFAQQVVTDFTAANQQLAVIAERKRTTLPTAPDAQQRAELQTLQALRGQAFDQEYVRDQRADHEQAIALFQREAQQGTDPDVKAFAQAILPVLQQHLQMVDALEGRPVAHSRPAGSPEPS